MADDPMQCHMECATADSAALNQRCRCAVVDIGRVHDALEARVQSIGLADAARRPHLFSPYALFVDRVALDAMGAVAAAVFAVARNRGYIEHVLGHAPAIARHDPGSVGGMLGLDFHLTVAGPRLIEINTNPGGLLLNALLIDAVQSCAPAAWSPWRTAVEAQDGALSAWLEDARRQLGRVPERMAIVDVTPHEQFLYPEFELYAQAFRERGVDAVIRAPGDLAAGPQGLHDANGHIDAVYNRLTDFALEDPVSAPLAEAYLRHGLAVTPHPRAHAIFADKRNLAVLGDADLLESWGVDAATAARLAQAIPSTRVVEPAIREAFWTERDRYFFKPATGFGSRGSYRGDKLTRRTWGAMASSTYVAQVVAPPGLRIPHAGVSLKADVRCYVSEAGIQSFAARLYQGQTTNMRTPGGGFAAVLTTPAPAV